MMAKLPLQALLANSIARVGNIMNGARILQKTLSENPMTKSRSIMLETHMKRAAAANAIATRAAQLSEEELKMYAQMLRGVEGLTWPAPAAVTLLRRAALTRTPQERARMAWPLGEDAALFDPAAPTSTP